MFAVVVVDLGRNVDRVQIIGTISVEEESVYRNGRWQIIRTYLTCGNVERMIRW